MKKYRFRRWLRNWLSEPNQFSVEGKQTIASSESLQTDGLRFTLHRANGGYVIETSRIDRVKDRMHHQMYIVHNDADIGLEIGKIITMENLRS